MLYWIPTLECLLTESELKSAIDGNRLKDGEYIAIEDEDIRKLWDRDSYHKDRDIPYIPSTPISRDNDSMAISWLIDGITPESYGYIRNRLREEIYRMEERFESLDNQLNNLNRMLTHTIVLEGKKEGDITSADIDSRAIELIQKKKSNLALVLRYLKDLYLAMHEEIAECMSMK